MSIIRFLLSPFSLAYQAILRCRNFLYDFGIFGVTSFDIPTISIGNLAFGGTGKTPHIEYLIRLLQPRFNVAVLSRGYKRKTNGYIFAGLHTDVEMIGDEPWQIFNKFTHIAVAVAENRVLGIPDLLFDAPDTQVVLLDDAFQHRAIKPGMNILLTDYNLRFTQDYLAPAGMLREYASAYKRADIVIVSKCDPLLNAEQKAKIIKEINPIHTQHVYFSFLQYGALKPIYEINEVLEIENVLLFSGIANPQSLIKEIKKRYPNVLVKQFGDHHKYRSKDIDEIKQMFTNIPGEKKIIISTEKDRTKLMFPEIKEVLEKLPIFYLPVEVDFFEEDKKQFNYDVLNYLSSNQ